MAVEADVERVHARLHRRSLYDLDVNRFSRHSRHAVRLSRLFPRPAFGASGWNLFVEARLRAEALVRRTERNLHLKMVFRILRDDLSRAIFEAEDRELPAETRNRGDCPFRDEARDRERKRVGHVEMPAFPVGDRMKLHVRMRLQKTPFLLHPL